MDTKDETKLRIMVVAMCFILTLLFGIGDYFKVLLALLVGIMIPTTYIKDLIKIKFF